MTTNSDSGTPADTVQRADPDEVDRESVMALAECPEHGENSLATAKVEDAVYVASCGMEDCDTEVRAPVVKEDGTAKVRFDLEPEEVPL